MPLVNAICWHEFRSSPRSLDSTAISSSHCIAAFWTIQFVCKRWSKPQTNPTQALSSLTKVSKLHIVTPQPEVISPHPRATFNFTDIGRLQPPSTHAH